MSSSTCVEVAISNSKSDIFLEDLVKTYLNDIQLTNHPGYNKHTDDIKKCADEMLTSSVRSIHVEKDDSSEWDFDNAKYFFFKPSDRSVELECFENGTEGEEIPASNHWILPSMEFLSLWENLIYEAGLKEKLLRYTQSAVLFSKHNVNHNIISCNRIILLHGPPGTGKTSLCKAIAQKIAIRLGAVYRHTHLIEINSHSLFSKWFSESGKLVMKLFMKIREIVAQPSSLVCVLIDEVESIAYARSSMSGDEPKDAMRVVNALLTQLDSLKNYSNVIILATSNIASSIDLAFLDRADIKQYIGYPSVEAIHQIYKSMFMELARVGILEEKELSLDDPLMKEICENSKGISGRTLRKIPFIAHACFVNAEHPIQLQVFLKAVNSALNKYLGDHELLSK